MMNQDLKKTSKHILLCDYCGYKTIIINGETNHLIEVPLASIPGGVPVYDPALKKTIVKKSFDRSKVFKCKECGRGIKTKKFLVADSKHIIEENKDEKKFLESEYIEEDKK